MDKISFKVNLFDEKKHSVRYEAEPKLPASSIYISKEHYLGMKSPFPAGFRVTLEPLTEEEMING